MLASFLSATDVDRASRTLAKLTLHDISGWALTGGFATEIHSLLRGREPLVRNLNDIDFAADSFSAIPKSLAEDFLFRHIHPDDPPGKTMAQLVDADSRLRVDVFRAFGETLRRTSMISGVLPAPMRVISLEDLLARSARLSLDLARGEFTAAKYVRDFLRLSRLANVDDVEIAWRDQRKTRDPATFAEASAELRALIPANPHLLVTPQYSQEPTEVCGRCEAKPPFVLAKPELVLALLGYC